MLVDNKAPQHLQLPTTMPAILSSAIGVTILLHHLIEVPKAHILFRLLLVDSRADIAKN